MIDYIKGTITKLTPTQVIVETTGIGFSILISLQTYGALEGKEAATVYIYHYLREDQELFYGFATKDERDLFTLLISVSGIGAASARVMLSSLTSEEIRQAILAEDINKIKSIKGIGIKSAQRLILELKDKIVKGEGTNNISIQLKNNADIEEATQALIMLGFTRTNISKAIQAVLKEKPEAKVEEIIKTSLQRL
ncbi:MAG: Holliday junction branch migration protein RuvA [Bacteroidales bacterium]|jgi:Holliday junction DNA helicase RuvA|nr:Holliday junction branch migration protein RuvA [Bacteroidales bacterium]MCI1784862.1 Holliday junction branch migration protein RuvA [Bacteroidales bacterium]